MQQDLISKKELLKRKGISYGQLYRWKRKKLIPEEWFVRKSTGQETFFPRDKILDRIDRIKQMKDALSLDEIASVFSPDPAEITLTRDEVQKRNIVSSVILDRFARNADEFPFSSLLHLFVLEKALQSGEVGLEEGEMLLRVLEEWAVRRQENHLDLIFIRKLGIATCLLISVPGEVIFEPGTNVVIRMNLSQCVEELKLKIRED